MLIRLLVRLVDFSRRQSLFVVFGGVLLAVFAGWFASGHLGVSTDTDLLFKASLPWRQRAVEMNRDFPQFRDLLVAVVDARIPEEADATAAELAAQLSADPAHFHTVRRPESNPFLEKEGLLFLRPEAAIELDGPDDRRAAIPRPAGRRPVGARTVRGVVPARHGGDAGRCGPVALCHPDGGLPPGAGGCVGWASEAIVVGDAAGRRPEQAGGTVPLRACAAASGLWRAGTWGRGDEGDARGHRRPAVREIRRRACADHRSGGAGG